MIRTQFCTVQLKVEKDAPGMIDLAEHLFALGGLHDHPQEIFWVIPYDSQMRIRRIVEVARGGYHSMDIPIPAVMSAVLLAAADRFAVAHNHSTGDVTPTVADLDLTGMPGASDDCDHEVLHSRRPMEREGLGVASPARRGDRIFVTRGPRCPGTSGEKLRGRQ